MVQLHLIRVVGEPTWFDVQDNHNHAAVAVRAHVTTKSNHQEYHIDLQIHKGTHDVNGGEDEDGVVLKKKAEDKRLPAMALTRMFDTKKAVLRK